LAWRRPPITSAKRGLDHRAGEAWGCGRLAWEAEKEDVMAKEVIVYSQPG
jgi:hypothetical protein